MHKPIHLLVASCCALVSYAQKTDSLVIHYKPDHFTISKPDELRLDSFLLQGWDRIFINGYTDETEGEEYNLDLSKKRSGEVYDYFKAKNIATITFSSQYFGESIQVADKSSEAGRALNRRTVVIGYRFPRVKVKPAEDPMKPVTRTLDNGFIITYRPGSLTEEMADRFNTESGINFRVITNTTEMRQNNLYNNTTNGEILSSVLIICNNGINPCNLDSPVLIKVPIPFRTKCPLQKVKFFNAVAENGKMIWQEQTKLLYPEEINGQQYIGIWMNDFCRCINFDFKIDPECFDTDSTQIQYVNADIKNLSAELKGLNSVYLPRKINDSTHKLLFLKNNLKDAVISFSLYSGKRRVRSFKDEPLTAFPYDEANGQYVLSTGAYKFYFPRQEVWDVVLKVNDDRYRVYAEKNKYEFLYLNRSTEKILVDFSIIGPKGRITQYKNQSIETLPFDTNTGYYIIDKKFLKTQKLAGAISGR